ncbi:MAG TPA: DNA-3-methyladenine glycosylase [Candidatus Paceibacterota bacterium]
MRTARKHLIKKDPVLGKTVRAVALQPIRADRNRFKTLVEAIISQQLSDKAATAIIKKFKALFPGASFPTPRQLQKTSVAKMRKAGVSTQKAGYIKDLAKKVAKKEVNLKTIHKAPDEEVIIYLTRVKGIGRWTAEMFLMFSLERPDVLSCGDLGLRKAMQKLYKLQKLPDVKTMEKIASRWRPHRTLACRYLWASLDRGKS